MHLLADKRMFRYLQGTKDFGLFYKKGKRSDLIDFTGSDYARDQNDRTTTSCYIFMLGSGAISCLSNKQPIITLFTAEAEFLLAVSCPYQSL